jgi:tetratricopeptide (TPR) repeat protein
VKHSAVLACALVCAALTRGVLALQPNTLDADALYRQRETLANAKQAANLWAARASVDYDSAWKLARVCYWIGTHDSSRNQRASLERGVTAGETAVRLGSTRPEGHFWMAANMGRLAESFGVFQGVKYRGRIKDELERVLAIDPGWQGGSADDALGQWYASVPRLFGGNSQTAEQHLRSAIGHDPNNTSALLFLGEMLMNQGRTAEARIYLQRVIDAEVDEDWVPEDREFKQKAAGLLKSSQR